MKFICVLKRGGDYTPEYVRKLFSMISRNYTGDFRFVCMTDELTDNVQVRDPRFIVLKLEHNFQGWWSKFEIFGLYGTVIYFDLDTVILGSLDDMVKAAESLKKDEFIGLGTFNSYKELFPELKFNSGVMAWNGDYRFVLNNFDYEMMSTSPKYDGDEGWIRQILSSKSITIKYWQDLVSGIYGYKRHCLSKLPADARVVCFYKRPRPHEAKEQWVKENWS